MTNSHWLSSPWSSSAWSLIPSITIIIFIYFFVPNIIIDRKHLGAVPSYWECFSTFCQQVHFNFHSFFQHFPRVTFTLEAHTSPLSSNSGARLFFCHTPVSPSPIPLDMFLIFTHASKPGRFKVLQSSSSFFSFSFLLLCPHNGWPTMDIGGWRDIYQSAFPSVAESLLCWRSIIMTPYQIWCMTHLSTIDMGLPLKDWCSYSPTRFLIRMLIDLYTM